MKKLIASFFAKPALVATVSLVIALSIGALEYKKDQAPVTYEFVQVGPGSIINTGTTEAESSLQHVSVGFLASGKVASVSVKVGDQVKKGMILATLDPESTLGALTQANAAYASAQANYQKVINGATASTVNVSKTSVDTANQNIDHLVSSAYTQTDNLIRTDVDNLYTNPNSYAPQFGLSFFDQTTNTNVNLVPADLNLRLSLGDKRIDIGKLLNSWANINASSSDRQVAAETTLANLITVKQFLADLSVGVNAIVADSKYQANIDKYKSNVAAARSTVDTLITNLQSAEQALVTANTNVAAVTSSARPEDIAAAKAQMTSALGALQIAQAAYDSRRITAPGDSTVTAVHINVGGVAVANASAIELSGESFSKDVAIVIPKTAVVTRDGKNYVLVQDATSKTGVTEKEIILGVSDTTNIEVISGLVAGDKVAIR